MQEVEKMISDIEEQYSYEKYSKKFDERKEE